MTLRVLITAPYLQPEIERFRAIFTSQDIELVVPPAQECWSEAELLRYIEDVDGAICGDDVFSERVLSAAKRLKVIAKWGTGIDSIDQQACEKLGIVVRNTPNAFSEPVADSVLGYMLAFVRRQPWMTDAMRRGVWDKLPGRTLGECTLGIVGVGNIGKAVAKRARSFNTSLLGSDPLEPPESFLQASCVRMVELAELLETSDFVSISCDLNPTSRHLFDDAAFARMKPGAVLINCARGPIVDEAALERALSSGRLAGAALDVFEREPLPPGSALRSLPQVLLAPHNASSSPRAWEFVHENTIRNLLEGLGKRI
jgi:D-3-phosphoglycerate dehydrogenase / 2-oxoglutarate reductase